MNCIWMGKQKVIMFPKFRENQKEASASALNGRYRRLFWVIQ